MTLMLYLLVLCFVAMRALLHWQRWNNPLSPWTGGTQVHLQHLIDSPLRTLQENRKNEINVKTIDIP